MSDRNLKPTAAWAVSNFGLLVAVELRRKDAIAWAVRWSGQPWSLCREYIEVTKVNLFPADNGPRLSDWK